MRRFCFLATCTMLLGGSVGDASAASPLKLIPGNVEAVVSVHDAKRAIDLVLELDSLERFLTLSSVQEQLNSTSVRRLRQFVAYFEKTLGDKWPALVERLTGEGIALGFKFSEANGHVVIVVQGKDEALMNRFVEKTLELIESELERQESKEKIHKGEYHGITGYRLGELHVGHVGATLILSNKREALRQALDLRLGREKKSIFDNKTVQAASKLLPKSPLVSAWLNMEPIRRNPEAANLYVIPRDDVIQTVLFGRYLDLLGRSPFICAALTGDAEQFRLSLRFPRGRDEMGPDRFLHLPPDEATGCQPLLRPKNTLYSSSFYLDLSAIWRDREQLFPKVQADGLADFEKTSGRVLGGVKLSTLLESVGARHRFLAVNRADHEYKKRQPAQRFPAFAFVSELRQPERFGRAMETLLRTSALLVTDTLKMELSEVKHREHEIVGYRFKEEAYVEADPSDVRFNFTPCFVRVGNQFVFCSNVELCKQLIDLLLDESKTPIKLSTLAGRDRFYSAGVADFLRSVEEEIAMQFVLDQAIPSTEARKQVKELLGIVRGLGSLSTSIRIAEERSIFDVTLRLK